MLGVQKYGMNLSKISEFLFKFIRGHEFHFTCKRVLIGRETAPTSQTTLSGLTPTSVTLILWSTQNLPCKVLYFMKIMFSTSTHLTKYSMEGQRLPSAAPGSSNECDLIWVSSEGFGEPSYLNLIVSSLKNLLLSLSIKTRIPSIMNPE